MREIYVCKFGGSSVANAEQIRKVEDIIRMDERRRFIIVSAPGKCQGREYKVTDLLYNLYFKTHNQTEEPVKFDEISLNPKEILKELKSIYSGISYDLSLNKEVVNKCLDELEQLVQNPNATHHDFASRGENFNARLIAEYFNAEFVDAVELVYNPKGCIDGDNDVTMHQIKIRLGNINGLVIIPGFYGLSSLTDRIIKTFARGGSDLTGALVAVGINATAYENWTDQPGIRCCDPRLFPEEERESIPRISNISYKETRELTYMGFEVFNDKAIGPVRRTNIPIYVKDTNNPDTPGTVISSEPDRSCKVKGIAGKNGFCAINIEKYLMDEQVGFGSDLLGIIAYHGLNYEHTPSGIDNVSVIVNQTELNKVEDALVKNIIKRFSPIDLSFTRDLALIAIVSEGMRHQIGLAAQATAALANAGINIEIMNQGSSESNMIFGVKESDYKNAIRALYHNLILGK